MSDANGWQVRIQLFFSKYVTRARPHQLVYRLTGGIIGSRLPGVKPPVLLLTVRGRKSGKPRTTPLIHFQIGRQTVVAATNNGQDEHSMWYWNLRSNPEAIVQMGRRKQTVRARQAEGAGRQQLWATMCEMHPLFAAYEELTDREIPVLVLEPVEMTAADDTTVADTPNDGGS